jgi:hypothetical protein
MGIGFLDEFAGKDSVCPDKPFNLPSIIIRKGSGESDREQPGFCEKLNIFPPDFVKNNAVCGRIL